MKNVLGFRHGRSTGPRPSHGVAPGRASSSAEPGGRLLLLPWVHHDVAGPYRASGLINVREGAATARPAVNAIPAMLVHRLLSLRAYDAAGMLFASDVFEGSALAERLRGFFAEAEVDSIHVHNAKPGCFNCRVLRAQVVAVPALGR